MNEIQKKISDTAMMATLESDFEINEIYIIKLTTERMLFKFVNIIKDLVDSKKIGTKIILEGLNGFLQVENEELVLYSIYRFMTRDSNPNLYQGKYISFSIETKIAGEEDVNENRQGDKKLEILKSITVKNLEHKFAPLYYKRITFRVSKDTKIFHFPIYFSMISLLYTKKLYYPCVTLIGLVIKEISTISSDLYSDVPNSQKTECFLYLFEFLLFIQVYLLICMKNFDRALYELLTVKEPISELNTLLYHMLLGLCYGQCFYYDLSVYHLCTAFQMTKPFVDSYKAPDDNLESEQKQKKAAEFRKKIPESKTYLLIIGYLTEMRAFASFIQCIVGNIMKLRSERVEGEIVACFRCKLEDSKVTTYCLDCKKVVYCSLKCLKKNKALHSIVCEFYLKNNPVVKGVMDEMLENFGYFSEMMNRAKLRKDK